MGVAAAIAALAVAVAGCGGSGDSGDDAAPDTAVTETSSTTDTSASTEGTSTESMSTEATGLAGLSEECKDLAEASQKFAAAVASTSNGGGDPEATADAFKEFTDQAPDELKDDFEALADVIATYASALKDIDLKPGAVPTADQISKLTQLGQSLSTGKARNASAAIAAWGQANCGSTP
jgi:hypothetical protein